MVDESKMESGSQAENLEEKSPSKLAGIVAKRRSMKSISMLLSKRRTGAAPANKRR